MLLILAESDKVVKTWRALSAGDRRSKVNHYLLSSA